MDAELTFIGHIETPYNSLDDCPGNIRPDGPDCKIVLNPAYQSGLMGLDPDQAILLLYWFDQADRTLLVQRGCWQEEGEQTGTFSLRSPHRPNPIAAAVLPIESIKDGTIHVRGLDCLNGTKVLDIKPAIRTEPQSI